MSKRFITRFAHVRPLTKMSSLMFFQWCSYFMGKMYILSKYFSFHNFREIEIYNMDRSYLFYVFSYLWQNARSQNWHWNLASPLWDSKCRSRSCLVAHLFRENGKKIIRRRNWDPINKVCVYGPIFLGMTLTFGQNIQG